MSTVLTVRNKPSARKAVTPQPTLRPKVLTDQPDPAWVRGRCPECGDALVSHLYYIHGKGYVIRWECWSNQGELPKCEYKLVL
jgi:hypothetical protein